MNNFLHIISKLLLYLRLCSYNIVVIGEGNSIEFHKYYLGLNTVEQVLIMLKTVSEKLLKRMHINDRQLRVIFNDPDICHICQKKFKEKDMKCVDTIIYLEL